VIVVFACCRRWRNNLNEPLDPFTFGVAAEQQLSSLDFTFNFLPLLVVYNVLIS